MSLSRLLIADIGPAHGVRGAVKLRLYLEDPGLLPALGPLWIGEKGDQTTRIKLVQNTGKSGWIATIEGVTDRTRAEKWRGVKLYADRSALPDHAEGGAADENDGDTLSSYYVADLVGLAVHDAETGAGVGTVTGVDNFGASDLLDIRPVRGHGSFYVPFTDDYVVAVDVEAGQIQVQNYAVFADPANPEAGEDIS